jgi:pimeloyl-ACP methyl ester carboxylesterase
MGESVAKPGLSNAQQMLEIIVEVIEHIIPNQEYGLIGHSYGSYLGLRLMQEHKDKITNALFICPVIKAYPENRKLPPFRIVYKDEEFISTLSAEEYNSIKDWMVIQTKETYTRYLNEFLPAFLSGQKDWQEDFFVGGYGFTDEDEVYQKICEVPTSFLCGKEDNVVGYQDAVDLSAKFNKGDVIILSEAGHNLPIEQTEKFNNILKHWITSVRKKIRAQI